MSGDLLSAGPFGPALGGDSGPGLEGSAREAAAGIADEAAAEADRGTYRIDGNGWVVTGVLGTGTWRRLWPAQPGSSASCPHLYSNNQLHVYKGGKKVVIDLSTYPPNPPLHDADAIALARAALERF